MVHGGMKLIKFLLFLFNFVFWLSGIGLIVFGAVIKITNSNYINFLGNSFLAAPILLIVVGCIIAVLGFFGCCGAIRENYCMTMTFAVLLGIIFILELAAGIASYVLRSDLENTVTKHVLEGMDNYLNSSHEASKSDIFTQAWDSMQQQFNCCGTTYYTDWLNASAYRQPDLFSIESMFATTTTRLPFIDGPLPPITSYELPHSCCNQEGEKCYTNSTNLHKNGCVDRLKRWVEENVAIVGGVGCGVAFIQVIGVILSCCFATGLRHEDEYFY